MECKVKGCDGDIQPIYRNGKVINNKQWICEGHTNNQGQCVLELLRRELIGHAKHNYDCPMVVKSVSALNKLLPDDMTCPVTGVRFNLMDWMGDDYPYPEPLNPGAPMGLGNIKWVSCKGRELDWLNYI